MLIENAHQAELLVREVRGKEAFIDFETKGLNPHDPESYIAGAAVKTANSPARYLSLQHPDSPNMPAQALADVWGAAACVSNHNRRFDLKMAHCRNGLPLVPGRDSMTAMTLEYENHLGPTGTRKGAYQLKYRAAQRFGEDAIEAETELTRMMLERGWHPKADLYRCTAAEIAGYACDDVNLVQRCFEEWLDPRLEKLGIADLAREYYDYDSLLLRMELDGLNVDRSIAEQYLAEAQREEPIVRRRIGLMAADKLGVEAEDVNPGSPVQMRTWLGLPSTEKWRLKAAKGDERAQALLSWRKWSKAVGTYYRPYLEWSDAEGVMRPSFWYTRTGRLTCFDPNLHATPHYGPEYKMKDCFVAPPGFFLLYADWSQAEMRLCAHYTQDPDLMYAFEHGVDIHRMVADMLGCDRQTAKPLNYGSAYGMGKAKLAREYGMTEADAGKWLQKYHARLRGPRGLYRRMGALAEAKGWLRFWDGRYRRFSANPSVRAFPHSASNSLLQGGVGAMSRRAMLRLEPWCYGQGGRMWTQIHDALIFCLPLEMDRPETYRHVRSVMEDFPFRVKMTVDMGIGRTWTEAASDDAKKAVKLREAA